MTPLRQRMLEDMSIRNLTQNTQQAYLQQVRTHRRIRRTPPYKRDHVDPVARLVRLGLLSSNQGSIGTTVRHNSGKINAVNL